MCPDMYMQHDMYMQGHMYMRVGMYVPVRESARAGQNQPAPVAMRMASTRLRAPVFAIARER